MIKSSKQKTNAFYMMQKQNLLNLTELANVKILEILCPQKMQYGFLLPSPPKKLLKKSSWRFRTNVPWVMNPVTEAIGN